MNDTKLMEKIEDKSEETSTVDVLDLDGLINELENENISPPDPQQLPPGVSLLINELENENISPKQEDIKKPSFIQNLIASFHRDRINNHQYIKCRFQKLAGISPTTTVAKLTISNTTFDLMKIPPWYDIIRFKICGFKYEVVYKCQV